MRLLRSFPMMLFALVILSIVGLCIAQRSVGLLLVAGALAVISWYITEGPRGRTLPKWVSNVLVVGVSLNVLVDLWQHPEDTLGVLGRYAVWLTLIKLYERRTARDHGHLLVLSFLLMLVSCMYTSSLLFGVVLLMYAMLGLYVLVLYQLYGAYESIRNNRKAMQPESARLLVQARPILGRHAAGHFRVMVSGLAMLGLALSVVVFIAFPRGIGQHMLSPFESKFAVPTSGYTREVDLIGGTRISLSRAKVLELEVLNSRGRSVRGDRPLRLRGEVLDEYRRPGVWKPRDRRYPLVVRPERGQYEKLTEVDIQPTDQTIRIRPFQPTDATFVMDVPIALSAAEPRNFAFNADTMTFDAFRSEHRDAYEVIVRSWSQVTDEQRAQMVPDVSRRHVVGTHGLDNQRVRDLARDILRRAGLPPEPPEPPEPPAEPAAEQRWQWNRDAATAMMRYLQSNQFSYTLDLSDISYSDRSDDPIVGFLFDTHRGHCEYFAAAFVSLCQNVGIPARMVIGYIVYEFDEAAGLYNVLEANAHAWAEIATGENRWTEFDPTPAGAIERLQQNQATFSDRIRWFYDRFDTSWTTGVVDFDEKKQAAIAQSLNVGWRERVETVMRSVQEWLAAVNRAFRLGPAGYIWMGIVATALVIAVIALVKLMRRSVAIRRRTHLEHVSRREQQVMLRQLGFYLDMLRELSNAGVAKPHWRPPLDHAHSIAIEKPAVGSIAQRITTLFYRARYGRRRLTRAEVTEARAMIEELARMKAAH